ncbi:MAG TPA: hypothetical protein VHG89_00575 [Verrucomicrobiae bacterium]|nr:hypothetical protein [Verrucomicrobiae bacterium]
MNDTETNPASSDFSEQIADLKSQIFTLMLALIVVTGALTAYLYYQSHVVSESMDTLKLQSKPIVQTFAQDQPIIQKFVEELQTYGASHPDFELQVLKKYNLAPSTATNTPKK